MSGPRLQIVTGKGGVGKTVVATTLALLEAEAGHTTLLAEAHGGGRVTSLLGLPPSGAEITQVRPNLFVVDMNPRAAIHEYARLIFRFESLVNAVFENATVRRFLRLIPSLGELVMLGKIWFHEQEQGEHGPRFDRIILDAPATGHALAMLRAPSLVAAAVPPGPLRDITRNLSILLRDPERTALQLVTTPEEMPVAETLELLHQAQEELGLRVGRLFINQRLTPLAHAALRHLAAKGDVPLQAVAESLALREQRRMSQEEQLRALPDWLRAHAVVMPRLVTTTFDCEALQRLADQIRPQWEQNA